jgi:hypothetical protein
MSKNVIIKLKERTDSEGKKYYVGKIESPVLIDCRDGAAFLVFLSEPGNEQLQIAPDNNN